MLVKYMNMFVNMNVLLSMRKYYRIHERERGTEKVRVVDAG